MEHEPTEIQGSFNSEKINFRGPTIAYDFKLNDPDVPYCVSVNKQRCVDFFRELGIEDEQIDLLKINILRRPQDKRLDAWNVQGSYDRRLHSINIYTDGLWAIYNANLTKVSLAEKNEHPELTPRLERLLHTKRLEPYLRVAPSERGSEFAKQLLGKAINRVATGIVIHESQHAKDIKDLKSELAYSIFSQAIKRFFLWAVPLGSFLAIAKPIKGEISVDGLIIGSMMGAITAFVFYKASSFIPLDHPYNPFEIRARKAQRKYKNDPTFRDLITITPK